MLERFLEGSRERRLAAARGRSGNREDGALANGGRGRRRARLPRAPRATRRERAEALPCRAGRPAPGAVRRAPAGASGPAASRPRLGAAARGLGRDRRSADDRGRAAPALELLGARAPVLVAIDDIQWLDRSSERALAFAVRRLPPRVGLLLSRRAQPRRAAARAGVVAARPPPAPPLLGPLSSRSLLTCRASVRRGTAPPDLVRLFAASAGIRSSRGARGRSSQRPRSSRSLTRSRARAAQRARLGAARGLLARAARRSSSSRRSADTGARGRDARRPGGTREALLEAEDAASSRAAPSDSVFTHPLVASTVYASASRPRRQRLHERLAPSSRIPRSVDGTGAERARRTSGSRRARRGGGGRGEARRAGRRCRALRSGAHPDAAGSTTALTRRAVGGAGPARLGRSRSRHRWLTRRSRPRTGHGRAELLLLLSEIDWLHDPGSVGPLLQDALLEATANRRLQGRIHAKIAALAIASSRPPSSIARRRWRS